MPLVASPFNLSWVTKLLDSSERLRKARDSVVIIAEEWKMAVILVFFLCLWRTDLICDWRASSEASRSNARKVVTTVSVLESCCWYTRWLLAKSVRASFPRACPSSRSEGDGRYFRRRLRYFE